jgi:hypothetical protein
MAKARPKRASRPDPLEQVRIREPGDLEGDLENSEVVDISSAPPGPEVPEPSPVQEPVPPPDPVIPPPLPPAKVDTYVIQKEKRLSIRGQIVTLKPGRRISEESHGPGIIEMLKRARVNMRKL